MPCIFTLKQNFNSGKPLFSHSCVQVEAAGRVRVLRERAGPPPQAHAPHQHIGVGGIRQLQRHPVHEPHRFHHRRRHKVDGERSGAQRSQILPHTVCFYVTCFLVILIRNVRLKY